MTIIRYDSSGILYLGKYDSRAVWPDLAKFHRFVKHLKILGNIFKVCLVLGKVFNSLWHNLYAFGQISLLKMHKYLKHNLVIWSHCSRVLLYSPSCIVTLVMEHIPSCWFSKGQYQCVAGLYLVTCLHSISLLRTNQTPLWSYWPFAFNKYKSNAEFQLSWKQPWP